MLRIVADLPYREVRMRGVAAKRTTIHFGWTYDYEAWQIAPADPIPPEFLPLRMRCAEAAGLDPDAFAELLITRYPEGAGIGWHRDAPMFGPVVAGVSLLSPCVLRFRRKSGSSWERHAQTLEPRSLYLLSGAARSAWQHSIDRAPSLRYSLTFRMLRGEGARR